MAQLSKEDIKISKGNLTLTRLLAEKHAHILNNCVVLHINHTFKDVFALNEILVETMGVELYHITIPYNNTTIEDVNYMYFASRRSGIFFESCDQHSSIDDIRRDSDLVEFMKKQINYVMGIILPRLQGRKLIVLQDGGYTAAADGLSVDRNVFGKIPNFLGVVEQTQSGTELFIRRNSFSPLNYPLITISRSLTKIRVESEFIAQRIYEELNDLLYMSGDFIRFKTVIIGGYGVIGRKLSNYLKSSQVEVIIFDIDSKLRRLARKEGFTTIDAISSNYIDESYCYIGVTGNSSFNMNSFFSFLNAEKDSYILASGSSKRVEFLELIYFFEYDLKSPQREEYMQTYSFLHDISDITVTTKQYGFDYEFRYKNRLKRITLLAEGFPINMYQPNAESVPDKAIDMIQSLMLNSIIALNLRKNITKGIHYVGRNGFNEESGIDEAGIVRHWCKLNSIHLLSNNPFTLFPEHPLEDYLAKDKYEL